MVKLYWVVLVQHVLVGMHWVNEQRIPRNSTKLEHMLMVLFDQIIIKIQLERLI